MQWTMKGDTKVFGIIGNPISHSVSPILHNFVYQTLNINAVYVPFLTSLKNHQKNFLKQFIKTFHISGLSVTIPYKNLAYQIADHRDILSTLTHASNTLVLKEDQIYAYNTDGPGAKESLLRKTDINNKNIFIIGYGGSASAIAGELLSTTNPESIVITGRNSRKAQKLVQLLNQNIKHNSQCYFKKQKDCNKSFMDSIDIVINTTPIGMKGMPSELPIPEEFILKKHIIMDIVYNPLQTPFLTVARRKKAKVIEGYWMLLFQAIRQMELFTGKKIPEKLISTLKSQLLKYLNV